MEQLAEAVRTASALRRIRRLQPAGGEGDYVAPPTYPHPEKKKWGVHSYETRRISGDDVRCVLLDSVQSQAARMEESLVRAFVSAPQRAAGGRDGGASRIAREKGVAIPHIVVDFTEDPDVRDIGRVTSMELPHRVFDATIRDSLLDGKPFPDTAIGREISDSTQRNATPLLRHATTGLVYGAWKSYWGGALTARFQRCITSEIIGVNARDSSSPASKTDRFNIGKDVKISMEDGRMRLDARGKRPSEYGHGSIVSMEIPNLGVTMDYARQTTVITLAGLRRLGFPGKDEAASHSALVALAVIGAEDEGTFSALRSRCDLVQGGEEYEWEIVNADGTTEGFRPDPRKIAEWLVESVEELESGGVWDRNPTVLRPAKSLVDLIKKSRERMLGKEASGGSKGKPTPE